MNKMILNIGPQHPSTHGVLRLKVELDGETIISCKPDVGYLHRGMEKIAEFRNYIRYLPMVDRVDYVAGFFYSFLFCDAVEKLSNIEIPESISFVRIIMMELNRIASHLLWLGTYLLDLGAISPIFYSFRERDKIITYFEKITGQRMMYNFFIIGGIRHNNIFIEEIEDIINYLYSKIIDYEKYLFDNPIFLSRTKNIGIISKNMAKDYALTGPNLRATGIINDYRLNSDIYKKINICVAVTNNGDCYDRYFIRIKEIKTSIDIIRQCIDFIKSINLPDTKQLFIKNCPKGEVYSFAESARGTSMCYINSIGEQTPYRLKWRTGSFYSTQILKELLVGVTIPDAISIYGSLDIVLPEVDR